jgi:glutathione reductase (NADPH)
MPKKQYDLVVIGTGTAASVAASNCRAAGWHVAIIDHLPFGGTCALRGCDPKKVLVAAAEAVDYARRLQGKGVAADNLAMDWPSLIAYKRTFTNPVPEMMERGFKEQGIDAYHGRARFEGHQSVSIGGEILDARYVLIASGAVPARLGIEGEEHLISSTEFLELESLPKRVVMVGGGYIAAEFSHVAARAGARVVVLQRGPRMLPAFDATLVGWLTEKSREIGIDVKLNARVESVRKSAGGLTVRASGDGGPITLEADLVVHAAGRVPELDSLDLGKAGVETEKGRLKLNDYLQSVSNPAVYAAGDAASKGPALTPVAAHDAKVVATNMIHGNSEKPNHLGVPSTAFTIPPIATVGLSEKQARKQKLKFRVNVQKASDWYTARRVAEPTYGYKVLIEEQTDRILGASLVGPHADEVINLFGFAIRNGLGAAALKDAIFAYPTGASDIGYML